MSSSTMVSPAPRVFLERSQRPDVRRGPCNRRERPESPEMTSLNFRHQDMAGFIAHHDL